MIIRLNFANSPAFYVATTFDISRASSVVLDISASSAGPLIMPVEVTTHINCYGTFGVRI